MTDSLFDFLELYSAISFHGRAYRENTFDKAGNT